MMVDVLRDFLFNSFFLWFAHLFNARKSKAANQELGYVSKNCLDQEEDQNRQKRDPLFQIQIISNLAKPRAFVWLQIQPLTICFNSCNVIAFFQIQTVSHSFVCCFLNKCRPDPTQRSSRQSWQDSLCQNGRAFAAKPANNERNPPSIVLLCST